MTAKEYLEQARDMDMHINTMLEELDSLKSMATKVTQVLTDMPGAATRDVTKKENVILNIINLEKDINSEIDRLIDRKREMLSCINQLDNYHQRNVLMLRYLRYESWEEVAEAMDLNVRTVYRLRDAALDSLKIPDCKQMSGYVT